ncbi:MAG TPA: 5-methyltetrahydropteroyltriglutamate--homocysteine S-methyltransferase [Propionibacteriaceae bacterium]|nr:5-methyltetrahydropteroyltriglutamate--homocysteine S-methyltransferase [Propionibacteriaceae bacterium]
MTHSNNPPIGATVLGYPRIGRHRELKKALEAYWAGRGSFAQLEATGTALRADALAQMTAAGLDSVPVNTFSYYDHVLDTMVMLGAIPPRFSEVRGVDSVYGFDAYRYFAMARGTAGVAPLEMTKWFDTNYHYLVPEIGPETTFTVDPAKPLTEFAEAAALGVNARVVLVGPVTFLALAKPPSEHPDFDPSQRLQDLTETYVELLEALHAAGVEWVQLDEPALVKDLSADDVTAVQRCYSRLTEVSARPRIFVATYFAAPVEAFPALVGAGVEAIGVDLTAGVTPSIALGVDLSQIVAVLGAVDGRNVWRADLARAEGQVRAWQEAGAQVAVSSSCSLLHVPYDLDDETALDPALVSQLSFADQKLHEVVAVYRAVVDGWESVAPTRDPSRPIRRSSEPNRELRHRLASLTDADRQRTPRALRSEAQAARLELPLMPTTTIGSFPQTAELRRARAERRAGRMSEQDYAEAMRNEITQVITLQEHLGLDVLVHGEPERNDMVQYFAEQLPGFAATTAGWVQSYGSRCVRPPILFGDVVRDQALTVEWTAYAASITDKPVKAMLTGPVTMLAWSYVRDDQPLADTADQIALALRDEIADLAQIGVPIIQVDEPALREAMPLRRADQAIYLTWAVGAFRLATGGVADNIQVHTHLCYSEFGEILPAIDRMDADVTSIEAARSRMELLASIGTEFQGALGPGVYDIHSPRVPEVAEMAELLRLAAQSVPTQRLWVNPDCGLKTRGYSEVVRSLAHMVEAAAVVRAELAS